MTDLDLDPVAEDISLYVRGGRLRSSADVVPDAVEAERIGIARLWLSERYDLKEAGVLLGGMAARTTRLKLGTAALFPGSRNLLLTAALGSTMHSAFGPRFTLGLGRSMTAYINNAKRPRRHLPRPAHGRHLPGPAAGDVHGDARRAEVLRRRCRRGFDGVYLQPFLTLEALHNACTWIREGCGPRRS